VSTIPPQHIHLLIIDKIIYNNNIIITCAVYIRTQLTCELTVTGQGTRIVAQLISDDVGTWVPWLLQRQMIPGTPCRPSSAPVLPLKSDDGSVKASCR
jgi:hypothetical protein